MPDTDQRPLTALPAPRRVSRKLAFFVITAACALVALGIVVVPLLTDDSSGDGIQSIAGPLASPAARTVPYVAFQNAASGGRGPHLELAALAHRSQPVTVTPLRCQRLDIAGGHGLCLHGGGSHAPHGLQRPDLRPRLQGAAHAQSRWAPEPCARVARTAVTAPSRPSSRATRTPPTASSRPARRCSI